jgi:hypothetical protein
MFSLIVTYRNNRSYKPYNTVNRKTNLRTIRSVANQYRKQKNFYKLDLYQGQTYLASVYKNKISYSQKGYSFMKGVQNRTKNYAKKVKSTAKRFKSAVKKGYQAYKKYN